MGQWLQAQARYLHLLLENEGLTRAPTCSMCNNAMEVKCSDCLGGNYFCKPCSIQSHKCTPFHRMARWTGRHFSPVSLYSLGFVLFLGHHGEPCPITIEVCLNSLHICICHPLIKHHYQGLQATQRAQPEVQQTGHTHPNLTDQPPAPVLPLDDSKDIQGLSTTLFEPMLDHSN
jgi:hypothetical protein